MKGELGSNVYVVSRGTSAETGTKAVKRIRDYAINRGMSLESHRSKRLEQSDIDEADIIVYMDNGNRKRLIEQFEGAEEKLVSLAGCIGRERIPDPNYLREGEELQKLLDLIVEASVALCDVLRNVKPVQQAVGH